MGAEIRGGVALSGGVMSDTVHDYMPFTPLEARMLREPALQRLRYVSQNGLAHLVFPGVRTSRFPHSLGSMHLASRFFASAVANGSAETRQALVTAIRETVRQAATDPELGETAREPIREQLRDWDALRSFNEFATLGLDDDEIADLAITEQALRLAALLHDVGHLPMSHDFEHAVVLWSKRDPDTAKQAVGDMLQEAKRGSAIHEQVGAGVTRLLLQRLVNDPELAPWHSLAQLILRMTRRILDHSTKYQWRSPERAALTWLHRLVAGEVDVDRCDYILRDGAAHGFDFVRYDLDRLVDNLTTTHSVDGDQVKFEIAIRDHGTSAVESFLISRYRLYQYGIRHHKVAQFGAALQHVISRLLERHQDGSLGGGINDRVAEMLDVLTQIRDSRDDGLLDRWHRLDDVWMIELLRDFVGEDEEVWSGLVSWRTTDSTSPVRSLWKRHPPIPEGMSIRAWNSKVECLSGKPRWDELLLQKSGAGTLVVRHKFKPFERIDLRRTDSLLCVVETATGTQQVRSVPLTQRSALVAALAEAWKADIQVQAFSCAGEDATDLVNELVAEANNAGC